ncbi:BsaWI family type II restriction enzyme [Roseicitreum antarcticum]|uniref:BsaWI family type II restriction enzyme n=1 Tax=Roseicitreum antarcticum TaxID=564137 RepID=UPI001CC1C298|nr:BsaWI family type II restriction enzyme [Roseicitreum antarcticum]
MQLNLDFGRGLGAQVDLQNISDDQYARIQAYFVPLINDPRVQSREAIGGAFVFATNLCPDANPSDIWHHVLYRTYTREKVGTNPEQSWVRTSGEGYEIALVERYNPVLAAHGIRMSSLISGKAKVSALDRMGLTGRIGGSKVDVMIEKDGAGLSRGRDGFGVVGGIHAKVSLAERVSDDIPASRIMMAEGLLSVLSTLDVKSFPPPHGDLVNRGELGTLTNPSDKRRYIEGHGDFSACFSYNLRTTPSAETTASGRSIYVSGFAGANDHFTDYLLAELT